MRYPAWFAIVVGIAMIAQWAMFLLSGRVPELRSEPVRIGFHLAAEVLTAVVLIVSGAGALGAKRWARALFLVGLGMLVYTSIVSPGYFAQRGQMGFLAMFGAILLMACAAITVLFCNELPARTIK